MLQSNNALFDKFDMWEKMNDWVMRHFKKDYLTENH